MNIVSCSSAVVSGQRGAVHDGNVNHRSGTRGDAKELRCGDALDREWNIVDADDLANGRRIPREPLAPVVVTKDRHLRCASQVIALGNQPPRSRNDSEAAEEIARDEFNRAEFGLPVDR